MVEGEKNLGITLGNGGGGGGDVKELGATLAMREE